MKKEFSDFQEKVLINYLFMHGSKDNNEVSIDGKALSIENIENTNYFKVEHNKYEYYIFQEGDFFY